MGRTAMFEALAQKFTALNGTLVALKFLNQRHPQKLELRLSGEDAPNSGTTSDDLEIKAVQRVLDILYLACKDSEQRIRAYLIGFKAPPIIKRFVSMEEPTIHHSATRLLRLLLPFLSLPWMQQNVAEVTDVYKAQMLAFISDTSGIENSE